MRRRKSSASYFGKRHSLSRLLFCRLLGVALGRPPGKTLCRFATLIDTDITVVTGLLGGKRGG